MAAKKRKSPSNFKKLSAKLKRRGVKNPDALAATIGRKKYGKKGMAKKAAAGRKRAARRKKR
jgi:hypothetical protein